MPELIDRQAALRLCKDADWEDDRIFIAGYNHAIRTMTQAITELPTIEPEVRRGRWIYLEQKNGYLWTCSACKGNFEQQYRYCPFCGANMEGGADNG